MAGVAAAAAAAAAASASATISPKHLDSTDSTATMPTPTNATMANRMDAEAATPSALIVATGASTKSLSSSASSSASSASSAAPESPEQQHSTLDAAAAANCDADANELQQPQQFCLRWNNYQTNLCSVFDQLLQSESFVDVTLSCDGHTLKAHKIVLSASSPYFQSLFVDNPCQHPIVIMQDVKWPELRAAVEFMYRGEINVSQSEIGPLLRVAEMLQIRGLAAVNGSEAELNVERSVEAAATVAAAAAAQAAAAIALDVKVAAAKQQAKMDEAAMAAAAAAAEVNAVNAASDDWDMLRQIMPVGVAAADSRSRPRKRRNEGGDCESAEEARDAPKIDRQCVGAGGPRNSQSNGSSSSSGSNSSCGGNFTHSAAGGDGSNVRRSNMGGSNSEMLSLFQMPPMIGSGGGSGGIGAGDVPSAAPVDCNAGELEIKPGIAEMIREEERVSLACYVFSYMYTHMDNIYIL